MELDTDNWDDDFEGGFNAFATASLTSNTGINNNNGGSTPAHSSRLSVHSESVAGGDEDWNLVIDASDEKKTIQSAQQAGIPIPTNVPTSALLGGTIKRLGGKKSRPKLVETDDWDNDIEMPDSGTPLQLKPRAIEPPANSSTAGEEYDDFDELEGSLGIRFAGRDALNRSSSVSAMSPSLGSVTAESEDELKGLELPEGQLDFEAILMKKRRAAEAELSDLSQPSPAVQQQETMTANKHKKSKLLADDNDEYNDFDFGDGGVVLDIKKRTLNRNIKIKHEKSASTPSRPAATTTVNFHDKPTDKPLHIRSSIPRPVSGSKPVSSRLEPVFESGASHLIRERRQQPTTTGAQLLRSKRSMPVLRSQQPTAATLHRQQPQVHQVPITQKPPTYHHHLRHDSDLRRNGAQSPPITARPSSRLSNSNIPDTPSRGARRADLAPSSLIREAQSKRTMTKPASLRRRVYGDGNELDSFDDLPTSNAREKSGLKQPVSRTVAPSTSRPNLRSAQSRGDLREREKRWSGAPSVPDRMITTPAPPRTPASPTKGFHDAPGHHHTSSYTPSYLRDTAASRIARESRLSSNTHNPNNPQTSHLQQQLRQQQGNENTRPPRSDGPLMPMSTNWKAQVAARSPHTSPSAQRQLRGKGSGGRGPQLIKGFGGAVAKTENGMFYNPQTLRWEGNENTLQHFDIPPTDYQSPPLETPTPTAGHAKATSYMDIAPSRHPYSSPQQAQHAQPPPPPRPALIAPMSAASAQGVQVNGGMVFDPQQMKWLKIKPRTGERRSFSSGGGLFSPLSPSVTTDAEGEEEEDAFAGIEDLRDDFSPAPGLGLGASGPAGGRRGSGIASPVSLSLAGGSAARDGGASGGGAGEIHEEFDLGPKFIESQIQEEGNWRRRCAGWFPGGGEEARVSDEGWRWGIREMVG